MLLATEIVLLVTFAAAAYQTFAHSSPKLEVPTADALRGIFAHMSRAQYTAFLLAIACLAALVGLEVYR